MTIDANAAARAKPSLPNANRHSGIPIFPEFGCINGVTILVEGNLKILIKTYPKIKPKNKTKTADKKITK
jgi:hypothetical protein